MAFLLTRQNTSRGTATYHIQYAKKSVAICTAAAVDGSRLLYSGKEFLVLGACVSERLPRLVQGVATLVLLTHTIDDEHQYQYNHQQDQNCTTDKTCTHQQHRCPYQLLTKPNNELILKTTTQAAD